MEFNDIYFAFFFLHLRQLKSLLAEVEGIEDLAVLPAILLLLLLLLLFIIYLSIRKTFSNYLFYPEAFNEHLNKTSVSISEMTSR